MLLKDFSGTERELNNAIQTINLSKTEFEEYKKLGHKLMAVKRLKELTGLGLRPCKDVCDFYWDDKISSCTTKEDRKEKLERLAKVPLVDELISKFENLKEDELHSLLMKLSVDELFSIDEIFTK